MQPIPNIETPLPEDAHGRVRYLTRGLIVLESSELQLVLDPVAGGKMRSLKALRKDWEFFFQDHHPVATRTDYSAHDISGCDECFPTVAACDSPDAGRAGLPLGDHGLLWNRPWDFAVEPDRARMWVDVEELGVRFERSCLLTGPDEVSFEYRVKNTSAHALSCIYSLHPLLRATPQTRFELPESKDERLYVEAALNWPDLPTRDWAGADNSIMTELEQRDWNAANAACLKFFVPHVREGKAALVVPEPGVRLEIAFDTQALPHLGVLTFEGYGLLPDAPYRHDIFMALEPTTGIGDELDGCRRTQSVNVLQPGAEQAWWIRFRIKTDKEPS